MIQQPYALHDLFGVIALEHRRVEFDTSKRVSDLVGQLHRHLSHRRNPLQSNALFALALQFSGKRLHSSLEFTIGALKRLGSRLKSPNEVFQTDGMATHAPALRSLSATERVLGKPATYGNSCPLRNIRLS